MISVPGKSSRESVFTPKHETGREEDQVITNGIQGRIRDICPFAGFVIGYVVHMSMFKGRKHGDYPSVSDLYLLGEGAQDL